MTWVRHPIPTTTSVKVLSQRLHQSVHGKNLTHRFVQHVPILFPVAVRNLRCPFYFITASFLYNLLYISKRLHVLNINETFGTTR